MVEEKTRTVREADEDPVETAGETTAAAAVSGPVDTRPVGEGTRVGVEGDGAEDSGATGSE